MGSGHPRTNITLVGSGDPADQIVDCPDAGAFDAVVTETEGTTTSGRLVIGEGRVGLQVGANTIALSLKDEVVLSACIRMGHTYSGRLRFDEGLSVVEFRRE